MIHSIPVEAGRTMAGGGGGGSFSGSAMIAAGGRVSAGGGSAGQVWASGGQAMASGAQLPHGISSGGAMGATGISVPAMEGLEWPKTASAREVARLQFGEAGEVVFFAFSLKTSERTTPAVDIIFDIGEDGDKTRTQLSGKGFRMTGEDVTSRSKAVDTVMLDKMLELVPLRVKPDARLLSKSFSRALLEARRTAVRRNLTVMASECQHLMEAEEARLAWEEGMALDVMRT